LPPPNFRVLFKPKHKMRKNNGLPPMGVALAGRMHASST